MNYYFGFLVSAFEMNWDIAMSFDYCELSDYYHLMLQIGTKIITIRVGAHL